MHTKVLLSKEQSGYAQRAIVLMSHHVRSLKRSKRKDLDKPRQQSQFNSKSYSDALQRAFNRAKEQIYLNPDMQFFITLTYKGTSHTPEDVLHHIKMFIKKERRNGHDPKYIFVMEYQKRGSIHVHMIANHSFTTHKNKNGYLSLTNWRHGFSSVLHIKDFDNNFKPYLYLFKYMRKAQRIGKSFIHSSRNLNNYVELTTQKFQFNRYTEQFREYSSTIINGRKLHFYRYFLKYDTIRESDNIIYLEEKKYDCKKTT